MNEFLHIGFDAYVNASKVRLIVPIEKDKLRRELTKRNVEKNSDSFWNACGGKDAKTLLILEGGVYVTSAISTDTLTKRHSEYRGGSVNDR